MARLGIGQDGYARIQKETMYGVPATDSMTLYPIKAETNMNAIVAHIEKSDQIGSRFMQSPSAGRKTVSGELSIDMQPELLGEILNLLLGPATTSANPDGSYSHDFFVPISGDRVAESFTFQQAKGAANPEEFAGCILTGLTISSDSEGHVSMTANMIAQSFAQNVSRITAFSYPVNVPYNFSFCNISIDATQIPADSLELTLDLGYETERFKLGSDMINQPVFQTKPSLKLSCEIDADDVYLDSARTLQQVPIDISFIHNADAGTSTKYQLDVSIPSAMLVADTTISNANDLLKMSLEYDCSFGGLTPGSPVDNQIAEFRVVDATASYL